MGFRVIKTALSVVIAMYAAHVWGLASPASAGLLAILGIEVTKKKGLQSAVQRIGASVMGLLFGSLLFHVFGFHAWVVGLFVLIVFPILHRLKLSDGMVTGAVVMFHLYAYQNAGAEAILNEIKLLVVGLGTATLINIAYMPKADRNLVREKERVERLFSDIFRHIASHLRDNTLVWDGKELLEAAEAIEKGAALAKRSLDNSLIFGGDPYWRVYFYMRGEQLDLIHRMTDLVARVYQTLPQGELVAAIFDDLSEHVKEDYYIGHTEKELEVLNERYKEMPLPGSREEFEVRSAILQLNTELLQYLYVAKKQKKQRPAGGS
ncbi:aromatic acid exporter family protein [Paenibacillus hexagrammi]|uniref:Aromatic acid exporter family protein n=1 Tax=Paenibacillus hexagrammi TaxID=2908839 RepID=A0ABY3SSR5_9BACL|nr:aromatic acid exporter family protein [Paenibacillus sp. YPD9-1]UJF36027.1 aromatic acid exporter family protein [Paenibacillus sp. YPD9-1]